MANPLPAAPVPAPEPAPPAPKPYVAFFAATDEIFDKRAMSIGLLLAAAVFVFAGAWRLAVAVRTYGEKRKPPAEYDFKVGEPTVKDFQIRPPSRDLLQAVPEKVINPSDQVVLVNERPNIHYTTDPTVTTAAASDFIQSSNLTIDTPKIEVGGTDTAIEDLPQEISAVSETTTWALNVIAAETSGPADIYKYKNPTPRDKMATHFINAAPRPGRPVKLMPKAFGDQDVVGTGTLGSMNINLNGTGMFFRTDPNARFGDIRARSAVDSALGWLALHQEADGMWAPEKTDGAKSAGLADTALALLAFMGGGNTTRKGEHTRSVLRGAEALMREEGPDGSFLKYGANDYTQAIVTIALCEAYGRARDERVGLAAQKAVAFCEKAVNSDGGWRYAPKAGPSDMSVTAWFVQALKTAKLAQMKFDHTVFSQALSFVDSVTDKGGSKDSSGAVTYMFEEGQEYGHGHPALTSAGMLIRQFTGTGVRSHLLVKGAELTRSLPPNWNNKDFYYWYYATYAMHNMSGEYRVWWNKRIRDTLLENQSKDGENAGSWDPKGDKWAMHGSGGGRVYTTALGALCLEVYYRYSEALTSFGSVPDLDELIFEK